MQTRLRDRIVFGATVATLALVVGTVVAANMHETDLPTLTAAPAAMAADHAETSSAVAFDAGADALVTPHTVAVPASVGLGMTSTSSRGQWGADELRRPDPGSWEFRELENYAIRQAPTPGETLATTEPAASAPAAAPAAAQPKQAKKAKKNRVEVEHNIAAIPDPPQVAGSGEDRSIEVERPDRADDPWAGVRRCESHNNYSINTGNGFYGAYQFTISTWNWVSNIIGRTDLDGVRPDLAAPSDQDIVAQALAFEVAGGGLGHWPICGRFYG
jgi:hypothetical protein